MAGKKVLVRPGFSYVMKDGVELRWTGQNVCICTKCDDIYKSVSAFDRHIRDGRHLSPDECGLVRNARGQLVTEEWQDSALDDAA